ncbi:hypothetical protein D3C80_1928040 [compost metagenome]
MLLSLSVYRRMLLPSRVSNPLSRPLSGAPALSVKPTSVMLAPGAAEMVKTLLPVSPTAPV